MKRLQLDFMGIITVMLYIIFTKIVFGSIPDILKEVSENVGNRIDLFSKDLNREYEDLEFLESDEAIN